MLMPSLAKVAPAVALVVLAGCQAPDRPRGEAGRSWWPAASDSAGRWFVAAACAPDGSCLAAAAGDGSICVWRLPLATNEPGTRVEDYRLYSLAVTPDGTRLLVGCDRGLLAWRRGADEPPALLASDIGHVRCLAVSPDGKYIAVGGEPDEVLLCDATSGRRLRRFGADAQTAAAVLFSSAGNTLAARLYDHSIHAWNVNTGAVLWTIRPGPSVDPEAMAWSPDDTRLLTVGLADYHSSRVTVWDATTGNEAQSFLCRGIVVSASFVPGRPEVLLVTLDGAELCDAATGQEIRRFEMHDTALSTVLCSSNGECAIALPSTGTPVVWDARTGDQTLGGNCGK